MLIVLIRINILRLTLLGAGTTVTKTADSRRLILHIICYCMASNDFRQIFLDDKCISLACMRFLKQFFICNFFDISIIVIFTNLGIPVIKLQLPDARTLKYLKLTILSIENIYSLLIVQINMSVLYYLQCLLIDKSHNSV